MKKNQLTFAKILIAALIFFAASVLAIFGWSLVKQPTSVSPPMPTSTAPAVNIEQHTETSQEQVVATMLYTATEAQTARELLDTKVGVEYQDFGEAGSFILSVDGLASDNEHYWAVYVNNEYAEVGVDQLQLQPGDQLKLVYEEIDPSLY